MRAAYYETNGPARDVLKLGEVETPRPGPGEVRVRVRASGINPSDVKTRAGTTRRIVFPRVIPHSDGAGEIDEVGPGVSAARLGERVWIWNGQWKRAFGTAAEYVVLPSAQAVRLPHTVSFEIGACLGIPALTASHAVALAGLEEGQPVLVSGGAGAVGHYAIQLAKAKGAFVISTVSSAEKAARAKAAGADRVIDYRTEDVAARVKDHVGARGVERVIEVDISGNAKLIPNILAPKGKVVVYGANAPETTISNPFFISNGVSLVYFIVYELEPAEREAAIAEVSELLDSGWLETAIGAVMPLDEIVAAHEALEAGRVMGNLVLTVP
ncbi:MAG TPA: NADPH:quinone reductase [Alphaproteobacteria bacterium]|nr:NADPH:quinone reductase [Alphaproteobacteria bacterium]